MIRLPRFTPKELQRFEEQSIENMLIYYGEEMQNMARDDSPSSFLSRSLITRFLDLGILERNWGKKTCKLTLTRKGRDLYGLP